MTPDQFRTALETIGWSNRHVASLLGCDVVLPLRWGTGKAPVPPAVAQWLDKLAKAHSRLPAPADWRKRS